MKKTKNRHLSLVAGCTLLLAVMSANAQTTTYTFKDVMYEAYYNLSGIAINSNLKTASIVYDDYITFIITTSSPYCSEPIFSVSCSFVDTNNYETHVITWVTDKTGEIVSYNESINQYGIPLLEFMTQEERGLFMDLLQAKCTDAILISSGRVIKELR